MQRPRCAVCAHTNLPHRFNTCPEIWANSQVGNTCELPWQSSRVQPCCAAGPSCSSVPRKGKRPPDAVEWAWQGCRGSREADNWDCPVWVSLVGCQQGNPIRMTLTLVILSKIFFLIHLSQRCFPFPLGKTET